MVRKLMVTTLFIDEKASALAEHRDGKVYVHVEDFDRLIQAVNDLVMDEKSPYICLDRVDQALCPAFRQSVERSRSSPCLRAEVVTLVGRTGIKPLNCQVFESLLIANDVELIRYASDVTAVVRAAMQFIRHELKVEGFPALR